MKVNKMPAGIRLLVNCQSKKTESTNLNIIEIEIAAKIRWYVFWVPCLVLSYHALPCLVRSCPVVQSCPVHALSCLALSYFVFSCPVQSSPVQSSHCPGLSCLVFSCLILSFLTLSVIEAVYLILSWCTSDIARFSSLYLGVFLCTVVYHVVSHRISLHTVYLAES